MNRLILILAGVLLLALFLLYGLNFSGAGIESAGGDATRQTLIETQVEWLPWSERVFALAARQDKPVYLNLSPFWCSQCSQMDLEAYNDESVVSLLNESFIPIRVDPDQQPDIGERYHLGGYPSCVILDTRGELLGGGTYLPADSLSKLLSQVERYWTTNRSFVNRQAAFLANRYRRGLDSTMIGTPSQIIMAKAERAIGEQYDSTYGGFGTQPKFPQPDVLRFMLNAVDATGRPLYADVLYQTLDAQQGLLDPIWGGFYRYARFDDWSRPSCEKLLANNASLLKLYLSAFLATSEERFRATAEAVLGYLEEFLKSDRGWGFWNSQHADLPDPNHYVPGVDYYLGDDAQRRAQGIPPIDTTAFAGANCLALSAYLEAAEILERGDCREYALLSLDRILEECFSGKNGVSHELFMDNDHDQRYLSDQLALAELLLDAYELSGEETYLTSAILIFEVLEANYVDATFGALLFEPESHEGVGRLTARIRPPGLNCRAAVIYMRLHHLTMEHRYYEAAARILKYLFRVPLAVSDLRFCQLADTWLWFSRYPVKFVMVGNHGDRYDQLVAATYKTYYPRSTLAHLRAVDGEVRLGELTFPDTDLPQLFICGQNSVSTAINDPETAAETIENFLKSSE